mgnify:CR=1 FL=1
MGVIFQNINLRAVETPLPFIGEREFRIIPLGMVPDVVRTLLQAAFCPAALFRQGSPKTIINVRKRPVTN